MQHSSREADLVAEHLRTLMLDNKSQEIISYIDKINRENSVKVGILGHDGIPAFGTELDAPAETFSAQKSLFTRTKDALIFYKPLNNEKGCHKCHSLHDSTRGMIVIKHSREIIEGGIRETARRILLFAVFLGLTSEIFLIIVLKKMILKPIATLNEGAEILKTKKLDHRIDIKSNDEIGALASCFNDMAESLEKSHVNLENVVRQRTKDLRVIAELSSEVFRGDLGLKDIIGQFLNAITDQMGYSYAALCLIDNKTGLIMQELKRGTNDDLCDLDIALSTAHPFAEVVREAKPAIKKPADIYAPDTLGNVVIIPILSHQRKRCREINLCTLENCPAFDSPDDRCWLISDTLCRSPQAIAGKEKIYGCLHCDVFPVLGVLIAGGKGEITKTSMHSLEIISSEIASAIENQRFIDSKKNDISNLIKLHDISVEAIRDLNMDTLIRSIVLSATVFAKMDAAIIWLIGKDGRLYLKDVSHVEKEYIPASLPIDDSFLGRAIIEERAIETIKIDDVKCLGDLIERHRFLYVAVVPLKLTGTVYGCLSLFKKSDFFMTDSEKAITSLFASQAASAIQTALLYGELLEQKEFSETIFNNISSGIIVLDNQGRILKINKTGEEILKINPHYVLGKRLADIYPETEAMLTVEHNLNKEIVISLPDGNSIPIGFANSSLLDQSHKENGIIILFRDLTEIKKLQEALRKKQNFEAMGKVVAGVAHEIRNPLFGISAIVQILEREIISEQHQTLLQAMLREIYRLKNLIDELLLYSRPSKLNITEIDFDILMEKIKHYIRAKKDDVVLNLEFRSSGIIKGDMDKLTQVILNLVDNAVGAGSKKIDIIAARKDNAAVITVKDDGIGIQKETLDKIFDPFFTTKKEGTGLGLSICRKIIEDHGGEIVIQSAKGEGTTVTMTF